MVVYFNATLFRRSVTTYRIVASTVYPFSSIRPYMRCERNVSESHHGFAAKIWFGGTSQWTPAHERAMVAWQLLLRQLCYKCCLLCTCSNYVVDEVNFGWCSSMEMSHNFLYNIHVARVRWKNFILHLRMHARMGVQSYISPYLTHFLWICHLCWDFQPSMTCLYWGTSSGSKPTRTSMLNLKACGKG